MITLEDVEKLDGKKVGPFYHRALSGRYLITNDQGRYLDLSEEDFKSFVRGDISAETSLGTQLKENGFLREQMDFGALAKAWRKKNAFLSQGTGLHIVVVTLRCNQKCVYCQVSSVGMDGTDTDMTEETASKVVRRIFESSSDDITIEFQGGEPLVNWPIIQYIVKNALEINKTAKKNLMIGLVSNLSLMDEEKLKFLLDHNVTFCTSLDGPAEVHEQNRKWLGGTSHGDALKWWKVIMDKTKRKKYRIDALTTITKHSLKYPKEIVDQYLEIGARGIYLRYLSPLGFALKTWEKIGYTSDEYLHFYRMAMDYIIEINLKNKKKRFFENMAKQFLTKILLNEDPNNMDVRNPCGAGIGQMAYNFDGSLYTCDEGRMLSRMKDESFRMGHVSQGSIVENMRHPAVRSLIVGSDLDAQPQCSSCAYKPYDGVCPIYNYVSEGDIISRMHSNQHCHVHMGILDYLFERMRDPEVKKVFEAWVAKAGRPIRADIFSRN